MLYFFPRLKVIFCHFHALSRLMAKFPDVSRLSVNHKTNDVQTIPGQISQCYDMASKFV